MRYLPHTEEEIAAMLEVVGVDSLEGLFSTVPPDCRLQDELDLPPAMTEWELGRYAAGLSDTMTTGKDAKLYLGAGSYEHLVPSWIPSVLSRQEYVTAYTPYQPEISQGTLQAIFEYQSLTAKLLGMEVSNASVWDGASAFTEGVLMAFRATRRERVAVSRAVHPNYRQVLDTYLESVGFEMVELPVAPDGRTDLSSVADMEGLAAVAVQSPNFFGCVEDVAAVSGLAHGVGALCVVTFSEALAYGLLKNPGSLGADIVAGEGQSLGIAQSFGGPYLGILTATKKLMRNMPGRLIGKTTDIDGRDGFVITLSTREQHIRREKATSNICSNQSLCAVNAAMYMAGLGKGGLRELSRLNYDKAEYLKGRFRESGVTVRFAAPTFNEFVVELPKGTYERLLGRNIFAGVPLGDFFPTLEDCYLVCVTETKSKEDLDNLVSEVLS